MTVYYFLKRLVRLFIAPQVRNLGGLVVIWRQGRRVLTAGQLVVRNDPRLSVQATTLTIRRAFSLHRLHCNENPIYVFLIWELRDLSPYFQIHVSVSVFIFPGSVHIFPAAE
jgi:hypothetical protein